MRSQTLIRRYAQGLISSAKDEGELESFCDELRGFDRFLSAHKKLRDILQRPFLPAAKKTEIAEEILDKLTIGDKAKRFLLLLVENGRLTLLPEIVKLLPVLWNEEHGIASFQVSSVISLSAAQKKRLEEKLTRLERRPVSLTYKLNPSLIGGLSIRKGNMVYDASIRGDIQRLKQKIAEE